jgi:phosphoribosylaminoimidazolecarboxamide formyltransferase / IMP cyclohydrolase
MSLKKIQSALISTFYKEGLEDLVHTLGKAGVTIYSTGGTQAFVEGLGYPVHPVENLTGYPSILDGRVKTLHPKVFGGILAMRNPDHLEQLAKYEIPTLDLVVVNLYPFEETVASGQDEQAIIEKIDIGGISLIRAAAKNFNDVCILADPSDYKAANDLLIENNLCTDLETRRKFAAKAFGLSARYDSNIEAYFSPSQTLRYGENPHQSARFIGDFKGVFDKLSGKEISYNNLVDIDAALDIMRDLLPLGTGVAILKHTNTCGLAVRETLEQAWHDALACDPTSAFGGIIIANKPLDLATAQAIDTLFYEVLMAPEFPEEVLALLSRKKNRILLKIKNWEAPKISFKQILNGRVEQDKDLKVESAAHFQCVTQRHPSTQEVRDLEFAAIAAKHLKSNTIALVKNLQLIGMGCGQTSRIDALHQALHKAQSFGFSTEGAVMASDAFFPFPDCVELANKNGITAVIQPGGSVKDQDSIDYCNHHNMAMVTTGIRHFKH